MISLKTILYEGRYDKITGIVIKDVFKELNKAIDTNGSNYRGMDIRPTKPVDDFEYYFAKQDKYSDIGNYSDDVSGLEFDVQSAFLFSPEVPKGKPYVEGFAQTDEDEAIVTINIAINPEDGKSSLSKIQAILRDTVRHELEHLTQKGWNLKSGKEKKRNVLRRMKIAGDKSQHFKYYILDDEVEPMLHGLYAKAKTTKQPFQKVVDGFLDELMANGTIDEKGRKAIYTKWKSWIPKIGGLPTLK